MSERRPAVTVLYFDGCPGWWLAVERLRALGVEPELQRVETAGDVRRLGFTGSPTILVDGRDPFASGDERVGMSCRMYRTPEGLAGAPTLAQLRDALHGRTAHG